MTPTAPETDEVFRYLKDGRMRTYSVNTLSDRVSELWVTSVDRRGARKMRKLVTFDRPEDVELFLEEIRRELRTGGWSEV